MTKKKGTKRALLSSGLALLMCASMLIGTTFAWFTDTASTAVNTIQSGTLDVALYYEVDSNEWKSAEGKTLNFKTEDGADILWEPGCTYELPRLKFVNEGNLALKYNVIINGINGSAKLNEAIEWTIEYTRDVEEGGADDRATTTALSTGTGILLPAEDGVYDYRYITIKGHMKEEAGNEYQGLTIDGVGITVFATQATYESDSYDDQYDAAAPALVWDGTVGTVPEADVNGVRHIETPAEFAAVMAATTRGNSNSLYLGQTLSLECSIDFGGRTISGIGGHNDNVVFTFEGNGNTLSNFKIDARDEAHKEIDDGQIEYRYAGLFQQFNGTVRNLNVRNAEVVGDQMVGVIASNIDAGGRVENCRVYNSTVIGAKKVGAVAGYIAGAEMFDCYAENCTVIASDPRTEQSAEIIGYINTTTEVKLENYAPVNVTVLRGTAPTTIDENTSQEQFKAALAAGGYIQSTVDIDAVPSELTQKDTILDLGGNTLRIGNGSSADSAAITTGNLTVKGGKVEGGYTLVRTPEGAENVVTFEDVEFDYTIENPVTYGPCTDFGEKAVQLTGLNGKTTFVFRNCTFTNSKIRLTCNSGYTDSEVDATFDNCTFNYTGSSGIIYTESYLKGNITVKDCTFNITATGSASAVDTGFNEITLNFEGRNVVNGSKAVAGTTAEGVEVKVMRPSVKAYSCQDGCATVNGAADHITLSGDLTITSKN